MVRKKGQKKRPADRQVEGAMSREDPMPGKKPAQKGMRSMIANRRMTGY